MHRVLSCALFVNVIGEPAPARACLQRYSCTWKDAVYCACLHESSLCGDQGLCGQDLPSWLMFHEGDRSLWGVPTIKHLGASSFTFSFPSSHNQSRQYVQHHVEIIVHSASRSHNSHVMTDSLPKTSLLSNLVSVEPRILPSSTSTAVNNLSLTELPAASLTQLTVSDSAKSDFSDHHQNSIEKSTSRESRTEVLFTGASEGSGQHSGTRCGDDAVLVAKRSEHRQCNSHHRASLVLCATPDKMNASQRVQVVRQMADFLSIPADSLTWLGSVDDRLLFLDEGCRMEAGGASDHSNCSEESHSELFWSLSCSASRHLHEFSRILQHNVQVGRIEREVGTVVVGWYLATKVSHLNHRRRRRRVGLRTPVATPALYPPSATVMTWHGTGLTTQEDFLSSSEPGLEPAPTLTKQQMSATVMATSRTKSVVFSTAQEGGGVSVTPVSGTFLPHTMLQSSSEDSGGVMSSVYDKPTPTLTFTSKVIFSGDLHSSSAVDEFGSQGITESLPRPGFLETSAIKLLPHTESEQVFTHTRAESERTEPLQRSWPHASVTRLQSSFQASPDLSMVTVTTLPLPPAESDHHKDIDVTALQNPSTPLISLDPTQLFSVSHQPLWLDGKQINKTAHIMFSQEATVSVPLRATVGDSLSSVLDQRNQVTMTGDVPVGRSTLVSEQALSSFTPSFAADGHDALMASVSDHWYSGNTMNIISELSSEHERSCAQTDCASQSDVRGQLSSPTLERGLASSEAPGLVSEEAAFSSRVHESTLTPRLPDTASAGYVSVGSGPRVSSSLTTTTLVSIRHTADRVPEAASSSSSRGQPVTRTTVPSSATTSTTTSESTLNITSSGKRTTSPGTTLYSITTVSKKWKTVTSPIPPPTRSTTLPTRTTPSWRWRTTPLPSWTNATTPRTPATTRATQWWWRERTTVAPRPRLTTTPWWLGRGDVGTTRRRKMPPKPVTKAPVTIEPPNNPPFLVNSISYMTVMLGCYFEKRIPDNMFYDVEDGSTRFLTLTLTLPYDRPLPVNFWVQLDSSKQILMGLPLVADLDMDYNSVVIVATDSQGLGARNPISLYVNTSAFIRFTHRFIMKFGVEFGQFMRRRDNMINLMKKIGSYFGDESTQHVTVVDVGMGSFILSWTNSSLSGSSCWNETIHYLLRRMVRRNGSVRSAFKRHIGRKLRLLHIRYQLEGVCLYQHPSPTVLTTTDEPTLSTAATVKPVRGSSSDLVTEVILPVLIALLLLLLIIIVVLLVYRCHHRGMMHSTNKDVYAVERRPVMLQNDLPNAEAYRARPKKPRNVPYDGERETGSFPRSRSHTPYDHYRLSGSLSRNRPNSYTFDDELTDSRPVTVIFNNFDSIPRRSRPPSYWNDRNEETPPNISVPPPYFSTTSV